MVYWVYVLESVSAGCRYVGSTGDLPRRVEQHNQGLYRYTKGRRPWRLVYQEECATRLGALQRERFFKTGQGREILKGIIQQKSSCPVV